VTKDQITDAAVPPKGFAVVGLSLTGAMLPTEQLAFGDTVRVVPTGGEGGAPVATGGTVAPAYAASVVGLSEDDITGNALVNVQVEAANAPSVAKLAAAGQVALVLDSQEQ
jgi:hypothetical protein